jgi:hypothetical protein
MRAHHRKAKAKPKAEKPKVGRPEIPVDENVVRRLAQAGVPVTDISHIVGLSRTRLYERFGTLLDKSAAEGSVSLRVRQHALALNGNVTMLIWLGKNRLGQSDKQEIGGPNGKPVQIDNPLIESESEERREERRMEGVKNLFERVFERTSREDPEFDKIWIEWKRNKAARRDESTESGPALLRAGGQR